MGVVVEFVVEAVDVVEEGMVPHDLHHLAEHLGPSPVSAVVLQRYYKLEHLHLCQSSYSVLVQEVEYHELVKIHCVSNTSRHHFPFIGDAFLVYLRNQLFGV